MAKKGCFWLGIVQHGHRSSKGVDCDILTQYFNMIDRILIPPRYTFFSESPYMKDSCVKCA
jgi:hypothetical protein